MTRLQFILRAQTAYHLQSPYLYRLYNEVLFARIPRRRRQALGLRTKSEALHYKLRNALPDGSFLFLSHPHRQEARWQEMQQEPRATVTLDLYHSGIVLLNPKLQKQHLLLR